MTAHVKSYTDGYAPAVAPIPDLDPDDRDQLDGVAALVRTVLRDAATAVYLYGSAVHGGLRADSDLDIFVVTGRATTPAERQALIEGLMACSRSSEDPDRRHLEVTAVVLGEIRPWRYPPALELQYGDWWRPEFGAGDWSPWTSPSADLAVLLTSLRAHGVPLFGPPVAVVVDPVPSADLERAVRDVIPELLPGIESRDHVRNSLLTLARIWFTLATGGIESKDVAAAWAIERLPAGTGAGLRLALAGYLGEATDTWDEPALATARTDWEAIIAALPEDAGSA
jgi:streptomycin 3"-adenylyltransferase